MRFASSTQWTKEEEMEVIRNHIFLSSLGRSANTPNDCVFCGIGCSNMCSRIRDIFSTIFNTELKPSSLNCHHMTNRKKSHFGNLAGEGVLPAKESTIYCRGGISLYFYNGNGIKTSKNKKESDNFQMICYCSNLNCMLPLKVHSLLS